MVWHLHNDSSAAALSHGFAVLCLDDSTIIMALLTRMQVAAFAAHKSLKRQVEYEAKRQAAGDAKPVSNDNADLRLLAACAAFVQWLQRTCLSCLYPGAPFERVGIALELVRVHACACVCEAPRRALLTVYALVLQLLKVVSQWDMAGLSKLKGLHKEWKPPHPLVAATQIVATPSAVAALLNLLVNSWDSVRACALRLLQRCF